MNILKKWFIGFKIGQLNQKYPDSYPPVKIIPMERYLELLTQRDQARLECKLYKEKYFALFEHYQQDLVYDQNCMTFLQIIFQEK